MAEFAKLLGEINGMDYAPIRFEISDDLSYWSPSGSEVGPGAAGAVAHGEKL